MISIILLQFAVKFFFSLLLFSFFLSLGWFVIQGRGCNIQNRAFYTQNRVVDAFHSQNKQELTKRFLSLHSYYYCFVIIIICVLLLFWWATVTIIVYYVIIWSQNVAVFQNVLISSNESTMNCRQKTKDNTAAVKIETKDEIWRQKTKSKAKF